MLVMFNLGNRHISVGVLWFGVLIQKFRLCDAALWDFWFLLESSHFCDDRSLQDAAVQGLETGQDTQTPLEGRAAVISSTRETQSCGWDPLRSARQERSRWSKGNYQGNLWNNLIAQVISFACSCSKFYGILINFKLKSALVYGRHTKLPEGSESFTCYLTESFLLSLLMINSPGLVWERKILPALTQGVPFLVNSRAAIHSVPRTAGL